MLFYFTVVIDLAAMVFCLWMAFYLFARGLPSKITLRGVILLLALSAFFFSAYYNLFGQIHGMAAWRAVFKIIGLCAWNDLTLQLLTENTRKRHLPWIVAIYTLGLITILSLITGNSFIVEQDNLLYLSRMEIGLPYVLYGTFLVFVSISILYNLLAHDRVGLTTAGRYFLFASLFSAAAVGNAILAMAILAQSIPRITQDLLVFCGVFMLGISVARHSSLIERRTTLQDFPLTGLTILSLTTLYALAALRLGIPLKLIGPLAAFVVVTHSLYGLVHETLERLRLRNESSFRKQLRRLANEKTDGTLCLRLQTGLDLLCQKLDVSCGFIAIKYGDEFVVAASRRSLGIDERFPASAVACEDVCSIQNKQLPGIVYVAPSFDGKIQIALLGIGKPNSHREYSTIDLDLLSEVADQIGTIVSLSSVQPQISQIISRSESNEDEVDAVASNMLGAMAIDPDQDFIKSVEEGLRQLSDFITLGQSPLADKLGLQADSHIKRGKKLQTVLIEGIELLRPAPQRPPQPLPRVWYNYVVLHDAYVEGIPNREVIARLYISEGTFNRTRRNAIRGLARLLMEKYPTIN
jgi:hypothetical protein